MFNERINVQNQKLFKVFFNHIYKTFSVSVRRPIKVESKNNILLQDLFFFFSKSKNKKYYFYKLKIFLKKKKNLTSVKIINWIRDKNKQILKINKALKIKNKLSNNYLLLKNYSNWYFKKKLRVYIKRFKYFSNKVERAVDKFYKKKREIRIIKTRVKIRRKRFNKWSDFLFRLKEKRSYFRNYIHRISNLFPLIISNENSKLVRDFDMRIFLFYELDYF